MSEKNHPNFNTVRFATDIVVSYFKCVRGGGKGVGGNFNKFRNLVIEFAESVEELVDSNEKQVDNKLPEIRHGVFGSFPDVDDAIRAYVKRGELVLDPVTGKTNIGDHHYYYLHDNGELISKHAGSVDSVGHESYFDSDFVKEYWKVDLGNRADLYHLLIRAKMLGAKEERIEDLRLKFNIDNDDCGKYAELFSIRLLENHGEWQADDPEKHTSVIGVADTAFDALYSFYEQQVNKG